MSEWVCGNCKSINRAAAGTCYSCGGDRAVVTVDGPPNLAAEAASSFVDPAQAAGSAGFAALNLQGATAGAATADAAATAGIPATASAGPIAAPATGGLLGALTGGGPSAGPASSTHLATGLVAGLVAAVVASAIWYAVVVVTGYQVGLVAIAVGFLVGQAVVLGAGRHGSIVLVAGSVVLTLLALAASEYLIVVHFIGLEFAADGLAIEVLQPIDFMIEVVAESVQADPLTLLFWAIALFQAFAIPARLLRRDQA